MIETIARACVLIVTIVLGLPTLAASAEIYRWSDEHGNSYYVDGLASVPERYRASATPVGLRNSPAASSTADVASKRDATATTIRFKPGQPLIVNAIVNGTTPVTLMLDTGADSTLIHPRALVAAGVSLSRGAVAGTVKGVTGSAQAPHVLIDSLQVGEARVGRMWVTAHDMEWNGAEGLLGRDFLQQFNVTMDSARGVVTLTSK